MSELTPHQQKALTTSGHLALTANAGSGKTFVLARKYLSILLKENIDVYNVAAITFTEKAASELYYKIALLIDDKLNSSLINSEKKKLEKIRRQLVSANISTIHSFCIDILKQYPVEAQLDARFIPIDENLSNELIEISVDEMIRSAFEDELVIEDLKYLIRIFSSKSKLVAEVVKLIQDRKNVFTVKENIYSKNEEEIKRYFSEMFSDYFLQIWNKHKDVFLKNISHINSVVLDSDSGNKVANELTGLLINLKIEKNLMAILRLINQIKLLAFTERINIRKRGYLKSELGELVPKEIIAVEYLMSSLSKFEVTDDDQRADQQLTKFGLIILNFFDQALMIYERKKKYDGFIDFEDILLHTKILLQNKDVQRSLSGKYKYIMVDEFQDTNEIQYQIFLPILDYLKNGELFIVGDEKQSIYKFRDAEIEIFNITRDNIKIEAGEKNLLNLPDSFRMTPAICTFTNYIFKKLFSNPDNLYGEVPNTELVCARSDKINGKVELLISKDNETDNKIDEAEFVANKILAILENGVYTWKDISILVRKRKNFDELEKSFLKNDIPYSIVGGRGFYQRQTISDVYNYLSFLIDENNSSALVGILRSPFFSISDSILFEISLQKGNSYWNKFKSYVKEKNQFSNIITILEENIGLSDSLELSQLLKKLVTDQNYVAILTSREDGSQELANLDKLISIARDFNSKGFRNLYDFISYLKESISGLEDEAQAAFNLEKDAVKLMTIHQSKGLEFPVVFLFKTAEKSLSGSIKSKEIQIDKKFGVLAKLPRNENYLEEYEMAPIISLHNFLEERKNLAELKRLLYVAITRAKDEIYISATIDENKSFINDSFISLLSIGLDDQFMNDKIVIKDNLDYLIEVNGKYKTKSKISEIVIPIRFQTDSLKPLVKQNSLPPENFEIEIHKIASQEKGEIISSSKVSIYSQCPLKYFLTYEYGYAKLNSSEISKNLISDNDYLNAMDFNLEDENSLSDEQNEIVSFSSTDYGKLLHGVLEKETPLENINDYLLEENYLGVNNFGINNYLLEKLKSDLSGYFKSAIYQKFSQFIDYKNEFEIYIKDEDYFLHGILDKIVFNGKKIIVLDYKTDNIKEKDVVKRAEYYLMQLKFYLYIASKLFKGFDIYEGYLVFIKHPEHPVQIDYNSKTIKKLNSEVKSIIASLRKRSREKNYAHCQMCPYSGFSKKCIVN
jgi:ATP-dependent helicase/nuclease subunit A